MMDAMMFHRSDHATPLRDRCVTAAVKNTIIYKKGISLRNPWV
jgi:hypothetical protein